MESYELRRRKLLSFPLKIIWSCKTQAQLSSASRFCKYWLKWTKKEMYRLTLWEQVIMQEKHIYLETGDGHDLIAMRGLVNSIVDLETNK
jgi:hypothetical protein